RGTLRGHDAKVALREHSDEFPLLHHAGGSDDLTQIDVRLFVLLLVPTGAMIWTLIDRCRRPASLLRESGTTGGCFYVGIALCAHALAKLLPTAFALPTIQTLMTEFGQQTPMEALRNVMGASPAYTMFIGWAEVIAGTLLFFSRTRVVGALAAIVVLGHTIIL